MVKIHEHQKCNDNKNNQLPECKRYNNEGNWNDEQPQAINGIGV